MSARRLLSQPFGPGHTATSLLPPSQSGQVSRRQHLSPITPLGGASSGVALWARREEALGSRPLILAFPVAQGKSYRPFCG